MNEPPHQPDGLGDPAVEASGAHEGEPPRGTLFLTLVYLVVVALLVVAGIVIPGARRRQRARGGGTYGR